MCIVTIKTLLYPLLGDKHGHLKRPKLKGIVNFTHAISSFELCDRLIFTDSASGGTPFYKPYRYVPPQKVWVLRRFGLKTGIDFFHFALESGMVSKEPRECMNVFIVRVSVQLSVPNE